MQRAAGGLEAQFLQTGAVLENLSRQSDAFVGQVEKLIGLATGKGCDGSIFTAAIEMIERATGFLSHCEEETSRLLEHLRTYHVQIEQLLGAEAELQRAMLPLSIVQTLFRMESAPLGPAVQQMFGSLTQEIGELHGQMREIFGTKFKQLEQTHQTIGQVIGKLEAQVALLQQVTRSRKAQIDASLETLKKEMHNNEDRDVRLERFSRAVTREVQDVVIGLQFQDIVNQKLQHVLGALPQILVRAREVHTGAGETVAEAVHFVQQSCRLEAAQTQSARNELAGAEARIRTGVEKVLSQVTEMDTHCLSLDEFALLTTSFDGIVQVLVETIEEVRSVVALTVTNAAEAYGLLRPLGSLATDLTLVIRSMSGQIQLIGLNAQIKAAQAAQDGHGTGLEVLSVRTREISEETNRIGQQAATRLDELASGLAQSVKAFDELQARSQARQTELDEQGRLREQQLHAIRDEALETLRGLGSLRDEVRQQAQVALTSIEFTKFHQVTLPALQTSLQNLGDGMQAWVTEVRGGTPAINLVDQFKRDYTMASERQVFAGVMAAHRVPGEVAAPVPTPESAAEALLFEEVPATSASEPETAVVFEPAASEPAASEPAVNEPVASEPVASEPARVDPAAVKTPARENFGDNVELF